MRVSVFLLAAAIGCAVSPVGSSENAIVDGTLERGRPEVVFLVNFAGGACTGTIVAPRVVLTAKHCVQNGRSPSAAPANQLRVLVGTDRNSFTAQYFVEEVRPAPGRWDLRDGSDVAVLILSSAARETPRELSFDSPTSLIGDTFTAVGFGQTPSGSSGTKFTTQKEVQGLMGGFIFVDPAVCSGDSGGPLIGPEGRIWGVASFIFSQTGGAPRCGSAPGAYNSIRSFRGFIEEAIEDSGACVPREEECNSIDDNCDGEVDEGCTPIGAPCVEDSECVGETCRVVEEGAGTICTVACNPLQPLLGCPLDMYCASQGSSCEGLCAPGGAGTLENGADCTDNTECLSAKCVDPGDGRRRCLDPCLGDGGDCLAGEACAAPVGACGACVAADIVAGDRGLGEPCDVDDECGSSLCFEDEGLTYCSRECADDEGCGDGFHCRVDRCVRGPRGDVGDRCVANEDCGSGICAAIDDRRWCTAFCEGDDECPEGLSCVDTGSASVCAPDLSLVGEDCTVNEDCATGLCAAGTAAGDVCTRFCGPDNACAPGLECTRIDGGDAICVPPSGGGGGGGGGCSTAGGAPFTLLAFLLPMLARRRRRR
ncbi:MAG: S1 family peptidase [Myxococcota bacterium]